MLLKLVISSNFAANRADIKEDLREALKPCQPGALIGLNDLIESKKPQTEGRRILFLSILTW